LRRNAEIRRLHLAIQARLSPRCTSFSARSDEGYLDAATEAASAACTEFDVDISGRLLDLATPINSFRTELVTTLDREVRRLMHYSLCFAFTHLLVV
jgi:hypothetical protein